MEQHSHRHQEAGDAHAHTHGLRRMTPLQSTVLIVFLVIAVLGCIVLFAHGIHPERLPVR